MKKSSYPDYLLAIFISLIQTLFIFAKGYFLSIEFTLYPYLVSNGFIPYKNILDQHFPSIFFGSFSLPLLSASSSLPLMILFLSLLFFTNLLFFRYLKLSKSENPLLWLTFFVVLMSYFSVNILWVETFVNLFLVIILNLFKQKNKTTNLVIGLLVSQIIFLRPTLTPAVFFLGLFLSLYNFQALLGLALGFVISFGYLLVNNNLSEFLNLAFVFNGSSYLKESFVLPSLRQMAVVGILVFYSLVNFLKTSKLFLLGAVICSLFAIIPRFGFEHLQPFILFTVLLASQKNNLSILVPRTIILGFMILILIGLNRNRYGNYFFQPHLYQVATEIQKLSGTEIYLFGASDLLYPLSGKLPVGNMYIPSLPWYLNYPQFQKLLYTKLQNSDSPILVDTTFEVGGKKLIDSSPQIYKYIKMNYNLVETRGSLEFYFKKP